MTVFVYISIISEKFNWTTEATKLLISLRHDHQGLFDNHAVTKKKVWQIIAQKFGEKAKPVDWSQLKGKWAKLERKYKDVKSGNGKSGSGRREFLFEREMEAAIGGNPNITPVATFSSMDESGTVSVENETGRPTSNEKVSEAIERSKGLKRKRESTYEMLSEMREERKKQHEEK